MFASNILRLLTGFFLLLLLARFWGAETFGTFMYPFTLSTLAVILVDYGFNLQVVRDVGKDSSLVHEIACRAFTIKLYLTFGMLIIGGLIFGFSTFLIEYRTIFCLLWLSNVFNSFGVLFNLLFRGLELFHKEVVVTFYANFFSVLLIGLLIWFGCGPVVIACGFVISKAFFMGISWFSYRSTVVKNTFNLSKWGEVTLALRKGFPFAVHVALGTLYFQVDTIIIENFLGAESVGIYQSGLRIMVAALIMTEVLSNVYLPRMTRQVYDFKALEILGTSMTRYCLCIGVLGFVVMGSGERWIVNFFYGEGGFDSVSSLFPLFGWVLLLRYLGVSYGTILTVCNRQTLRMFAVSLSLFVSVGLNVWLIPKLGLTGALFASIGTHIFLNTIYIFFTWKQVGVWLMDVRSLLLLCLCLISSYYFISVSPVTIISIVAVSVAFVGLNKNDWKKIFNRPIKKISIAEA